MVTVQVEQVHWDGDREWAYCINQLLQLLYFLPVLPQGPIFTDELFDLVFSFHRNKVFVWVINWGVSVEKEDIKIFLKFIYLSITSLYYILLLKISVSKFSSFFSQRHNCKKIIQVYNKALTGIFKIEYKMINKKIFVYLRSINFVKNTIAITLLFWLNLMGNYKLGPWLLPMTTVRILSFAFSTCSSSIITLLMVEICRSSTDWNNRCSIRGSSFTLMIMWSMIRQKKSQTSGNDGLKLMSTFSTFSCYKLTKCNSESKIQMIFFWCYHFFLISRDIHLVAFKYSASFLHIFYTVIL